MSTPRGKSRKKAAPRKGIYFELSESLTRRLSTAVFRADVTRREWLTAVIERACTHSEMGEPSAVELWDEEREDCYTRTPLQEWLDKMDIEALSTMTEIEVERLNEFRDDIHQLPTPGEQAILESMALERWVIPASAEMKFAIDEREGLAILDQTDAKRIEFEQRGIYGAIAGSDAEQKARLKEKQEKRRARKYAQR